ncbi:hypothetical protein AAMO2058_001476300 [Amorphochlora amoebiformis]|uniref:EF-hand domain-containing protein n=1 Tax=Amorphochlora amoebiformis TaxID=1561963 RepID=A0A7S0D7H8_9EUKA|mmetsp:Transcript_20928/g.33119  ORF Transcript_20928/g.33119 Transcript_20928/m.33119 type:complete len:408 (+) Transcript_20928:22-1245(+)
MPVHPRTKTTPKTNRGSLKGRTKKGTPKKETKKPPPVFTLDEAHDIKSVNWERFDVLLPTDRSESSVKKRKEIFRRCDPNGNGYLSVAEVEKGLMEVLGFETEVKRVIWQSVQRAHRGARAAIPEKKDKDNKSKSPGDDYVEIGEFRIFCEFLRYDLKILQMFLDMDTSNDHRVEYKEFADAMPDFCEEHGLPLPEDLKATFDDIDADKGGMILYDEFADWMLKHKVANPSTKVQSIAKQANNQTRIKAGKASMRVSEPKKSKITHKRIPSKTPEKKGTSRSPLSSSRRPGARAAPKKSTTPTRKSNMKGVTFKNSPKNTLSRPKVNHAGDSKLTELINMKFAALEEKLIKHVDVAIDKLMMKMMAIESKLGGEEAKIAPVEEAPEPVAEEPAEEPAAELAEPENAA